MEQGLKQRLVGAAALAALAVVFLPMVFDDTGVSEDVSGGPWIPPRPPELSGPQFAPLTEAEIKRGARLPPLPIDSTPDDPGSDRRHRRAREAARGRHDSACRGPTRDVCAGCRDPGARRAGRAPRHRPGRRRERAPKRPAGRAIESAPPGRSNSGASAARPTPRSYAIACRSSAFSPSSSASP